ncbi:MAG TPA: hypothetical protein VFK16_01450 [Gemmatimonadaceae bacterium]|jgi:hypothetical protein|nr:hypothetical protein [Gemmatimonadaceae bacterium]
MSDSKVPDTSVTPPAPLDRAAMERVLARAAELQARSAETTGAMTDQQIVELGKEVGLSSAHLRQALAEERTRPRALEGRGFLGGAASVSAERVVRGTLPEILTALDTWMEKDEWLQIRRQFADRIVWEPRHDFEGGVRRMFNVGGRGYMLSKASSVGATVVPTEDGRMLVRLDADISGARRAAVGGVAGAVTGGVVTGGILLVLNFAAVVAAAPVVILGVASYLGARASYGSVAARVQLALEQTLDRLERGERANNPSLLKLIAQAAGAAIPRH